MSRVTVGVPVYNGADFLQESLECLRTQTYDDFEVLIYDNASTDATPDIAKDFCARDARFKYFRQKENVGPLNNFKDALFAANSEYFCWRAHDDVSSHDWLASTVECLSLDKRALLGVSKVILEHMGGDKIRIDIPPNLKGLSEVNKAKILLNIKMLDWFYCLWRTKSLKSIFHFTSQYRTDIWGIDPVTIFPAIYSGRVATSNNGMLYIRVHKNAWSYIHKKNYKHIQQWQWRKAYSEHVMNVIEKINVTESHRIQLQETAKQHVNIIAGSMNIWKLITRSPAQTFLMAKTLFLPGTGHKTSSKHLNNLTI
jgi:glycosyltransferase involved in cell wall biosynthesis